MLEKMLALQNKRKKEGGFTLVELIVVLVILAILAALLIPALTGYIDKAREKQVVAETRQAVMAAQTLYDEAYGKGMSTTVSKNISAFDDAKKVVAPDEIYKLAELDSTKGTITDMTISGGKIATLTWKTATKQCVYTQSNGTYDVTDVKGS